LTFRLGYVGAALMGVGSGWLADRYGWDASFLFWVAGAFVAAILMALLWSYNAQKGEYY